MNWEKVRQGVDVKRLKATKEVYVLARSAQRVNKERAMRRKRLRRLWQRLQEIRQMKEQSRDDLLMRLGAAKKDAGRVWSLVEVSAPKKDQPVDSSTFSFKLRRAKLRITYRREGCYLLRAFVPEDMDGKQLWHHYMGLTEIEESFKTLKGDLAIRPIHHQLEDRIEAHIFLSFIAYCLHVALRGKLRTLAPGLTPRAVLGKFATVQMLDVHFPTTDGRRLVMPRYTQPDKDLRLLLPPMGIELPSQPPPRIESRLPAREV
jgi:transposase